MKLVASRSWTGGEVEVARGQARCEWLGPGLGKSGDKLLEGEVLEGRLGRIGGDQLALVEGDDLLGLAVLRRGDDDQPAAVVDAVLEHGGEQELLAPELLDAAGAQLRAVRLAVDAGLVREGRQACAGGRHDPGRGLRVLELDHDAGGLAGLAWCSARQRRRRWHHRYRQRRPGPGSARRRCR